MLQEPTKETYIALDEVTSQLSLTVAQSTSYVPLHQDDQNDWLPVRRRKTWFRMQQSWRSIVAAGASTAGLVLLVNLVVSIWIVSTKGIHGASVTIFTGVY